MDPTLTDWVQAIASVLTFGAALAAARIASKAPELAASYAEKYRRETAILDEERTFQITLFRMLMKGRAEMLHQDTRAAINLVEAAFPHDAGVREARRMFTRAVSAQHYDENLIVLKYLDLVQAVASAVGYGDAIDRFDIESGYYPKAMGLLDEAALSEAAAKIGKNKPDKD